MSQYPYSPTYSTVFLTMITHPSVHPCRKILPHFKKSLNIPYNLLQPILSHLPLGNYPFLKYVLISIKFPHPTNHTVNKSIPWPQAMPHGWLKIHKQNSMTNIHQNPSSGTSGTSHTQPKQSRISAVVSSDKTTKSSSQHYAYSIDGTIVAHRIRNMASVSFIKLTDLLSSIHPIMDPILLSSLITH